VCDLEDSALPFDEIPPGRRANWKLLGSILNFLFADQPGVISAWFRTVPAACLFVCKPWMLIGEGKGFVTIVFSDIIERQPVWGTQRRYRLSTIPQKALGMAAIVPGS
jgi:hypothetical protein